MLKQKVASNTVSGGVSTAGPGLSQGAQGAQGQGQGQGQAPTQANAQSGAPSCFGIHLMHNVHIVLPPYHHHCFIPEYPCLKFF